MPIACMDRIVRLTSGRSGVFEHRENKKKVRKHRTNMHGTSIAYRLAWRLRTRRVLSGTFFETNECIVFINDIHKHLLQFFMFLNTCHVAKINGIVTKTIKQEFEMCQVSKLNTFTDSIFVG